MRWGLFLALLVVLGVALGAALVVATRWQAAPRSAGPVLAPSAEDGAAHAPPLLAAEPAPARAAAAALPADPHGDEGGAGAEPHSAHGGESLLLRVEDEHGLPQGGVPVRYVAFARAFAEAPELAQQGYDLDQLCARFGEDGVSDERGELRVSAAESGGLVSAALDGRYGLTFLDHHAGEGATLVLREELALTVRVVDSAGAPAAGVPVALRFRAQEGVSDAFRCTSDDEGVARLAHLQELFAEGGVPPGACVALAILAPTPLEHALDPGPLPEAPLELVLPATASLELELVAAHGGRLELDAEVALEPARELDADEEWQRRYLSRSADDQRRLVSARAGLALVPHVVPGLTLDVTVTPYRGYRPARLRFDGPTVAGERARVQVTLEPVALLCGTLAGPAGVAWGARRLRVSLWVDAADGQQGRALELESDPQGRFTLALPLDWPLAGTHTLTAWSDEPDGRRWWGRCERAGALVPGANELGPWVLAPLPLLAAGRVVDEQASALAGVRVRLAGELGELEEGWIGLDETDAEGRFLLQAPHGGGPLELELSGEGRALRRLTVASGAEGLELVLERQR